ncbi:MAG: hypothetical protein AB7F23_03050 [Phycisphaerae bacterium]
MIKSTQNSVFIVCGNHTNAHTLIQSLKDIGFGGRVIMVRSSKDPILLADRLNPRIEKWVLSEAEDDFLPEKISKTFSNGETVYVAFTNERFHHSFADWKIGHPDDNINVRFGKPENISKIIDRFEFYKFIESNKLAHVPKTISGESDPLSVFGNEFVVRPKESWQSTTHREEVKIVRDRSDFAQTIKSFASRGVGLDKLCFQELLSIENESAVAIGGWFDLENKHLYCLRKRFQHPPGVGSGDVCERIAPPVGVMEQAVAILRAFEYEGPLELEFVFDDNSGEYKVIEINPRFWMQHGLIEQLSGHALLRRYIGEEPLATSKYEPKYWVNTVQCLYRALKFEFGPLKYYLQKDTWAPYGLLQAIWYAPLHVLGKMVAKK